jgi:lipopolysaccharide/colanic/teichoic acid biosynthesis glycosyltransferase
MTNTFVDPSMKATHRLFDLACSASGLVLLFPLLVGVAFWILLRDGVPIFYRQIRLGRHGRPFLIWKFRTMRAGAAGNAITCAGDSRITAVGAILRRYKLDELPQLFNVLRGDMSLVGPRPEVPEYVRSDSPAWEAVLQVRPGITDLASLAYRDEEHLLRTRADWDTYYREHVQPSKLSLNLAYLEKRSLWQDVRLILWSVRYSLFPAAFDPDLVFREFVAGGRHER